MKGLSVIKLSISKGVGLLPKNHEMDLRNFKPFKYNSLQLMFLICCFMKCKNRIHSIDTSVLLLVISLLLS